VTKPGAHNRLIVLEVNAALRPLGLRQMGRARLWYDDRGDSVILVEFQSHKNTPGTYLNVGVCWLWRPQEYFTFDFGHRIGEFTPFVDEESFVPSLRNKVGEAVDALQRYREMLQSPAATADALTRLPLLERSAHKLFNAAIASAIAGRWDTARQLANKIRDCADGPPSFRDPVFALDQLAQSLVDTPERFRGALDEVVADSRDSLKLPPRT